MVKVDFANHLVQAESEIAGSRLKGSLSIVLDHEIKCKALTLQFVGQESTRVKYTTTHNNGTTSTTTTHYANSSRNLFAVDLSSFENSLVVTNEGRALPGMYEVPYEVDLPDSLPSTMTEAYNSGYCKIMYQLKAEFTGSGVLWNYKYETEIEVVAKPLETEPIPYAAPPVTENVRFFCCFSRGSVVFGAKVNDTRLDHGETSPVSLSCCNNTTVIIKSIDAALMQECHWTATSHSESCTRTLQQVTFPSFNSESSRDLLAPRKSLVTTTEAVPMTERDLVFRDIESGKHTGNVTMPFTAHCSYAGSLMTIKHYILVKVHMGCCVNNPEIRIPVQSGVARPVTTTYQTNMGNIESDMILEPNVVVPNAIVYGGKPTNWEGDVEPDIDFTAQPTEEKPSVAVLLEQMEVSIMDMDIVQDKVNDKAWTSVFQMLSPTDFGKIVQKVNSEFDQPKVAVTVAIVMPQFTCAHLLAALTTTAQWNRSALTEQLLPFCRDLIQNQNLILSELDDWEKITTEKAFANALKDAAQQ
jgi:Arrestin (or S-antigen), C-terminal domain/Arrestin (or S-antigen), N-terminal domain